MIWLSVLKGLAAAIQLAPSVYTAVDGMVKQVEKPGVPGAEKKKAVVDSIGYAYDAANASANQAGQDITKHVSRDTVVGLAGGLAEVAVTLNNAFNLWGDEGD